MATSDVIAIIALAISLISGGATTVGTIVAYRALEMAKQVKADNKAMFKRTGVIELYKAWQGVSILNLSNCISPDVVKAVNALALTASLWNHDVIEKEILYESYWGSYRELYDTLYSSSLTPPGLPKRCRDYITPDMTKAYEDMKQRDLVSVSQTTI